MTASYPGKFGESDQLMKNYRRIGIRAVAAACSVAVRRQTHDTPAVARSTGETELDASQPRASLMNTESF